MKIKLYKSFEHWCHNGVIWLYSDPHFSDPDQKLMCKDWPSDEEQLNKINSGLSKNDTIVFLGDIGNTEFIKKIKNSYKVLILGNHDKGASNYIKKYQSIVDDHILFESDLYSEVEAFNDEYWFDNNICPNIGTNNLFDEVYEGPVMINDHILLSHEPVQMGFGINIHGHCHSGKFISEDNSCINICSNIVNFEKQRLDKLVVGRKYIDIHRLAIDKQRGSNNV